MHISVLAMIISHYININKKESEGTEHSSEFSLYRCRICENTLEKMLMNSHLFNMLQMYSGKCSISPKLHVFSSSMHGMENFEMHVFYLSVFLSGLNIVHTMWFCYFNFLLYTNNPFHRVSHLGCVCLELRISLHIFFITVYFIYIHTSHFLVTHVSSIICHLSLLSCVCHVLSSFSGS